MVRLGLVALVIAVSAMPARAGELARSLGLYPAATGAGLPMQDSKLEVTVRGAIVETVVTQTFTNRGDRATEATYIFPLPPDAAVTAMAIRIGTRTIRASIEKREDAQRRYEAAVRDGVGASLLEQERPDVFTQTIAAIPAKGRVEITLRYDTLARFSDGTWELALPMVVAPRYVPGTATGRPTTGAGRAPDTDRAPDASRVTPAGAPRAGGATTVAIHFTDDVVDLTSPTHELTGDKRREVALVDPYSDHDAVIRWRSPVPAVGWVEQGAGGGYAAVVVEAAPAAAAPHATRLLLVLDRAATMRGDADAVAHPYVRALLGALDPTARIAVSGSDRIPWGMPAEALRAIERAWTTPPRAFDLSRALAEARPEGASMVLVTDGLVADDAAAIAAAKRLGVAVHVIGVGPSPARGLLTQIAAATGGTVRFAVPGDDLEAFAKATVIDASTPASPLAVSWGTLAASDVVPGVLPRLGTGQAMLVLARVKRVQTANARARGELFAIETLAPGRAVDGATSAAGPLARRWARGKLDELLASTSDEAAITRHALSYGLVSPFTSLVAIGDEVVVTGGVKHSVAVPVSVPAGMQWQAVKKETTVSTSDDSGGERASGKNVATKKDKRPMPEPKAAEPPTAGALSTGEDEEADADAPLRNAPEPTVALGTSASESDVEVVSETTGALRRGYRITGALGGGLVIRDQQTRGLVALAARLEAGHRTLFGVEGALWLVGGDDVQGRTLLTIARRGIARWFELGAGAGLHLGDGVGPAGALGVRVHLPPVPRASTYLRYDAALLWRDGGRAGQSTVTLGIEYGF